MKRLGEFLLSALSLLLLIAIIIAIIAYALSQDGGCGVAEDEGSWSGQGGSYTGDDYEPCAEDYP